MGKRTTIIIIMGLFSFLKCGDKSQKHESSHRPTEKEIYALQYFGEIDLNNTRDYNAQIEINDCLVEISLNFYNDQGKKDQLQTIEEVLDNLEENITKANIEIQRNFKRKGSVRDYFDHHNDVVENINSIYNDEIEFLAKLKIFGIAFYPDEDNHHIVYWYSIGKDITNYNIVVRYDDENTFNSIDFIS